MRFLASVTDAVEAETAIAGGADLVDAKDPGRGPLGALDVAIVADIVASAGGRVPVSATLGHDRGDCERLLRESGALAALGVRYLKVGVADRAAFGGAVLTAIRRVARDHAVIVVPLADRALVGGGADLELIDAIAASGARGLLIDTHAKRDASGGRATLRDHVTLARLGALLGRARAHGLLCGLAGGLAADDVAALAPLRPDLLGFRGALCVGEQREARLAPDAVRAMRRVIDRCNAARMRAVAL